MTAEEKVIRYIHETGMLKAGDRVIAGVSGGADSVFLFYVLLKLAETGMIRLRAVHVHHGIRGEEAERDAAFVRELCNTHGTEFILVRRNIPEEAERTGKSLEEAGREARYEIFRREADNFGGAKIALAHHMDDLAETVIFRIARGTGVGGLGAMKPVSGDLIRPLLLLSREEIEISLKERNISWMEDSTNADPFSVRNRIRCEILPLLKSRVNQNAAAHIAKLAGYADEAAGFIREEAATRFDRYCRQSEEGISIKEDLAGLHPALKKQILKMALEQAAGAAKDLGSVHVEALGTLLENHAGAEVCLPYGVTATRTYDGLELRRSGDAGASGSSSGPEEPVILHPAYGRTETVCFGKWQFSAELLQKAPDPVPENRYTKWLDYGKINGTLAIRTRLPGDYIIIGKNGEKKTISDYFTDEKVPRGERDSILLVVCGSEVVWVAGMRIGFNVRIRRDTEFVLKISLSEKEEGQP